MILTQTPYGKDDSKYAGSSSLGELSGYNPYLVRRGYIDVVADVRGTGGSTGEWGFFDPVQGHDGATLVNWAAELPHADGKVGLFGASYMGINQFETAADAGSRHVKALFPIIAGNDIYRDTAFAGGFPDIEFGAFYLGLTAALNVVLPFEEHNQNLPQALADHVADLKSFDINLLESLETGAPPSYDQTYWQARNPARYIKQIVSDHIPAFLIGGWYDLFQRGELLNYSSFQNAFDHRPLLAPMSSTQGVTPRYQLIQGPWYHVTAGQGLDYHGLGMNGVALAWFDHWLKGSNTGITATKNPLHLEDLSTAKWYSASRYPLNQAAPTTYYLQSGGQLAQSQAAHRLHARRARLHRVGNPLLTGRGPVGSGAAAAGARLFPSQRSLRNQRPRLPSRPGYPELPHKTVQAAHHAGRTDRSDALCDLDHRGYRVGGPRVGRGTEWKRAVLDRGIARGQPARARHRTHLVWAGPAAAASLSPVHQVGSACGRSRPGHPL